jgi:hypothetical protein
MDANLDITAPIFAAYLKCPTKAYLTARKENLPDTFFTAVRERLSAECKVRAGQSLQAKSANATQIEFLQLSSGPPVDAAVQLVDCETASYASCQPAAAPVGRQTKRVAPKHDIIPVLYSPWQKSNPADNLLVTFGALAIGQVTGTEIPATGMIIYEEGSRRKTVKTNDHIIKTQQNIKAVRLICHDTKPPPLILNKHCTTCDFQLRCRLLAVEQDDLSVCPITS